MATLDRQDQVFVLDLGDDENRFNPDSVAQWNSFIDDVEESPPPRALVISARGKIWSNGLDLEWFAANVDQVPSFINEVHRLLARVLALGVPTVAAIQGHCFAAGAMLALACDERVMRADRGFFCLPEVDIHIPFTPGMGALIQSRLAPQAAHEAMTTGRRYGGEEALTAGIVQRTAGEEDVLATAIARASELAGKDPGTLSIIKERMYDHALSLLRDEHANSVPSLSGEAG